MNISYQPKVQEKSKKNNGQIFYQMESAVRSYCRNFPAVFHHAKDSLIYDVSGTEYIDFLSGAGALNYGHNNAHIVQKVIEYIKSEGIIHSLDLHTVAKAEFLNKFREIILKPRGLEYRIQFTGPTGTNAVEAALKLARKVTGRSQIAAFTNGFHGVTLGALAATSNQNHRAGAGIPLTNVLRLPYDNGSYGDFDTIRYARNLFANSSSGVDLPAAFIVETVQGEGGIHTARSAWLQDLAKLANDIDALLIIDDIQAGCGRAGTFFSFEKAVIKPDIICMSKSISGIGLPMAINLIRPDIDIWKPGEHNGTFRGHNLAFIAAAAALDYWQDYAFEISIKRKESIVQQFLQQIQHHSSGSITEVRGCGLIHGIEFVDERISAAVSARAFTEGLIVETCGPKGKVLKILPPLTIDENTLTKGLGLLKQSISHELTSINA